MGLTTKSSPIAGTQSADAAHALLLLAGAASAVVPSKPSSEEIEQGALLALRSYHPNTSLPTQKPGTSRQRKDVEMKLSNISATSTSTYSNQEAPSTHDDRPSLLRNTRKRKLSSRYNSLQEDVRQSVTRNCRKILANATEKTLPYLKKELDRFIKGLYSRGVCDEELAKRSNATIKTRNPVSLNASFDYSSEESEEKYSRVLSSSVREPSGESLVPIGNGHAKVQSRILRHMNWSSYTACTRKLLTAVFSRDVLATHSLTGKSSPAFPDKPAKKKLDPLIINDIIQTIVDKCAVSESQVRTSITTKCADESKMFRTREQKENKGKGRGKRSRENIPPSTSDSDD